PSFWKAMMTRRVGSVKAWIGLGMRCRPRTLGAFWRFVAHHRSPITRVASCLFEQINACLVVLIKKLVPTHFVFDRLPGAIEAGALGHDELAGCGLPSLGEEDSLDDIGRVEVNNADE